MTTVTKVALVPLAQLEMLMRKRKASCEVDSVKDNKGISSSKIPNLSVDVQKSGDDPNTRKAQELRELMVKIASDESLETNEQLQKYLTAIREYVLFKNKGLQHQYKHSHHQQNVSLSRKLSKSDMLQQPTVKKDDTISPTNGSSKTEQKENEDKRMSENEILSVIKGVKKNIAADMLNL